MENNTHRIDIVASTDIHHHRLEDIIAVVLDQAKQGSLYLYFLMKLSRTSKIRTITADIIGATRRTLLA